MSVARRKFRLRTPPLSSVDLHSSEKHFAVAAIVSDKLCDDARLYHKGYSDIYVPLVVKWDGEVKINLGLAGLLGGESASDLSTLAKNAPAYTVLIARHPLQGGLYDGWTYDAISFFDKDGDELPSHPDNVNGYLTWSKFQFLLTDKVLHESLKKLISTECPEGAKEKE